MDGGAEERTHGNTARVDLHRAWVFVLVTCRSGESMGKMADVIRAHSIGVAGLRRLTEVSERGRQSQYAYHRHIRARTYFEMFSTTSFKPYKEAA